MNFLITSFDGTVNIVLGVARALPCCANTAKRDDSALFTLDQVARVPRAAISFGLSRGENVEADVETGGQTQQFE